MNTKPKIKTRIFVILFALSFCFTSLVSTADAVTKPKAPRSVKVTRLSNTSAKLTWKKVSKAKGYVIYQKKNSGKYKKVKTITKGSTKKWTAKKLNKSATYRYKIKSYKKSGKKKIYSRYSKVAKLNPVPTQSSVQQSPYGTVVAKWNIGADTAETYDSQTANDNVTATLYSKGTLKILGTGDCMYGSNENKMPWLTDHSGQIKKVELQGTTPTNLNFWFDGCSAITDLSGLNIPDSVDFLNYTFRNCTGITSLSGLIIPDSVYTMEYTFRGCTGITSLNGFTIPGSVSSIYGTFFGCTGITNPNGLTISNGANGLCYTFQNCTGINSLSGLTIPGSVTNMQGTFFGCTGITDLTGFSIPSSVSNFSYAFQNCTGINSLNGFTIPNSASMMVSTFEGCTGITDIGVLTIPGNVSNMNYAFLNCNRMEGTINITANPSMYIACFTNVATHDDSTGVTVNYTAECENIDDIIATQSAGDHIVKGSLITP